MLQRHAFQRLTDMLVKGCEEYAAAYLDDIVIFSQTWEGSSWTSEVDSEADWEGKPDG